MLPENPGVKAEIHRPFDPVSFLTPASAGETVICS